MADFTPEEITIALRDFFAAAGKRTYVGLRYVPIFGRKGEDTMEWDGGLAPYEPLTIVLHEGNSYTSRTYVPAGVEITNTEYWAETGDYNGQVESYRQEVAALGESVSAIEGILPMSAFTGTTVAECIENDNIATNRLRLNVDAQNGDDSNPSLFRTIEGALAYACKRNRSYLELRLYTSDTFAFPVRIQNLDLLVRTVSGATVSPTVTLAKSIERCAIEFNAPTNSKIIVDMSGCTVMDSDITFESETNFIVDSTQCYIYSSTIKLNSNSSISVNENIFCYQCIISFTNATISFISTGIFYSYNGGKITFEGNNTFTFPVERTQVPFLLRESNLYYKGHFYVTDEYTTTTMNLMTLYNAFVIIQKTSADEISVIFPNGYVYGDNSIIKRTVSITELT